MIVLRTLGLIEVRGAGEASRVLAQPKRFALLAYLAITRRPCRRDTLLALLWPELDVFRARLSLRQAVHFLRSTLGSDAVSAVAGDVLSVGVNLECDATEFDRALDEGRLTDALAIYAGDLLPGFHVTEASNDFDDWLERERRRLRARAAGAAWTLADVAERSGNDVEAAHRARQAVQMNPDDEAGLRRLVSLLDRLGDRTGALLAYDIFARRLRADFEVEPTTETRQLRENVRSRGEGVTIAADPRTAEPERGEPAPGSNEPRPVRTPRSKPFLAVVAVTAVLVAGVAWLLARRPGVQRPRAVAVGFVQNEGGDSLSARLLPGLLATNLARVPGLSVLSDARLYEILGQLGVKELTRQSFADAARRAGAVELIEGVLYPRPGGALRLDVRRVDAATGAVQATYTAEGTDAFDVVDDVTATIANAFSLPAPGTPLAVAASGSLVARRFFEEALRDYYRGEWRAALRLFSAALAEDSSFAMAAYYAARSVRHFRVDSEFVLLAKAARLADRAPERDRLIIKHANGLLFDRAAQVAVAESLSMRYPNEPDGHLAMASVRLAEGDFAGAVPFARRVIAMDSLSLEGRTPHCRACEAYGAMLRAYASMGSDSFSAVERVAREWIQHQPTSATAWQAWEILATTLAWQGRRDEAVEALSKAAQLQPWIVPRAVFGIAVNRDETYGEAERQLRDRVRFDNLDYEAIWWLVTTLRHQGRMRESLTILQQTPAHPSWVEAGATAAAESWVVFELGRYRDAARRFEDLSRFGPDDLNASYAAHKLTWLAAHAATAWVAAGDTARISQLADSVARVAHLSPSGLDHRLPHYIRGLLWQARGQPERAVEEFRAAMFSPTLGFTRTNLELARAYMATGRPHEAIAVLREVLGSSYDGVAYHPTRTEVHDWLARAFEAAALPDSAAAHYRLVARAWEHGDPPYSARAAAARNKLQTLVR